MSFVTYEKIFNYKSIVTFFVIICLNIISRILFGPKIYFEIPLWIINCHIFVNSWWVKSIKVYNKNKTGLIITDFSENNEVSMFHLIEQTRLGIQRFSEIYIVFSNGPSNSKITSSERMDRFKNIFLDFDSNEIIIGSTKFILLTTDCLKYINGNHFDVFLQISPLCDIGVEFFNQNSIETRIIMGNFDNPENSLNLKKSWKYDLPLDVEFAEQEEAMKLCNIKYVTNELAEIVKLTYNNIQKLPNQINQKLIDKIFKLFVERESYRSPNCEDITINTNYKLIVNYLGKDVDKKIKQHKRTKKLDTYCKDFVEKMKVCSNNENMERIIKCISSCVEIVTECEYKDSDFRYESLDNLNKAKNNFIRFISKNNPDLISANDLTAMLLFLRPDINGKRFDENSSTFFKYKLKDY